MLGPSNLKTLPPLQVFSTFPPPPPPPSSSSFLISSMAKLKTLIHTLVFSHVRRAIRHLNKAKSKTISSFIEIIKASQSLQLIYSPKRRKSKKKMNHVFFGSFRLHYNFCSSAHVLPVPARVYEGLSSTTSHSYYDSNWNSVISTEEKCSVDKDGDESQLSGYLQWLEDNKANEKSMESDDKDGNEIDKLADLFIASCHEKFMLEKQESYRRFQETLTRSA